MVYDEKLAQRIRNKVLRMKGVDEKKMFGGVAFMLKGKMFVGVVKNELMVRVGKENHEKALSKKGARTMDFTGKPMMGFVFVSTDGMKTDTQLDAWITMAAKFVKTIK